MPYLHGAGTNGAPWNLDSMTGWTLAASGGGVVTQIDDSHDRKGAIKAIRVAKPLSTGDCIAYYTRSLGFDPAAEHLDLGWSMRVNNWPAHNATVPRIIHVDGIDVRVLMQNLISGNPNATGWLRPRLQRSVTFDMSEKSVENAVPILGPLVVPNQWHRYRMLISRTGAAWNGGPGLVSFWIDREPVYLDSSVSATFVDASPIVIRGLPCIVQALRCTTIDAG
ncbi:MAG TPA: hypothetical protein VLH09_04710, partial [Bryobacteraceae bacterium]|nr:hypothetical protein [Bryobacteraceae bacterium]